MITRAIRSYFAAIPAIRRFGRACKLRKHGRQAEALAAAREALAILRGPAIIRMNPAEAGVLACATILAEEMAYELHMPGAEPADIADTLAIIRANGSGNELEPWVPYLEGRLAK